MQITIYTNHREVCLTLVKEYAALFTEQPGDIEGEDSLIWFYYTDDRTRPFWKQWVKAALKVGLIYEGKVTCG